MKLNLDCVRDILLCVEENTNLRQLCVFVDSGYDEADAFADDVPEPMNYQTELLKKYDNDTLIYHIHYCIKADLLSESKHSDSCTILIEDLSIKGHEFIANIRQASIWDNVKSTCSKIGTASLPAVIEVAARIAAKLIASYPF